MSVVHLSAEHYWPGASIPIPMSAGGATCQWNNAFVGSLPGGPGSYSTWYGYDVNRPPLQHNGGLKYVVFSVVGEGKPVEFVCHTPLIGSVMTLWCPDHPEENKIGSDGYEYPWADYSAAAPYHPPSTNSDFFGGVSAIRHTLTAGLTYFLEVNGSEDGDFQLDVNYQQTTRLNDIRPDAFDVIIWGDGLTYNSVPVLNTNYTHVVSSTDDPNGGLLYTAWWKYVASKDTDLEVSWAIIPQMFNWFRLEIWRQNSGDPTPALLMSSSTQPDTLTLAGVQANDVIYFRIGSSDSFNGNQPLAQHYQLAVTGAKSAVQLPTVNPYRPPVDPPWNDPTTLPPDKFDPVATSPTRETGEDTLLNLVRIFSSQVKRAVRITGPTTIEMVNPATPLPTGWDKSDGDSLYHSASRTSTATDGVLSTSAGTVAVTGSAELVADDARLVRSTWRIPDRLPVYGGSAVLPPAPVQRVSLTFSPTGFRASVEFQFPAVPLAARRF